MKRLVFPISLFVFLAACGSGSKTTPGNSSNGGASSSGASAGGGSDAGEAGGGSGAVSGGGGAAGDDGADSGGAGSANHGGAGEAGRAGAGGQSGSGAECDDYGVMRVIPCGKFCATIEQTCASDGFWSDIGTCEGEGECEAGKIEQRDAQCGVEARQCSNECAWSDWGFEASGDGCTPGTKEYDVADCSVGLVKRRTCNDDCEWVDEPCGNYCPGEPRTDPPEAAEICIPEGPFIRGSTLYEHTQPIAEIQMSSYYIDRYPVTNGRYQACVAAGVCEPIEGSDDAEREDHFVSPKFDEPVSEPLFAMTFCEWDGGRLLPTGAQWEKAARGPAPRANEYLWGDTEECTSGWNSKYGCPGSTSASDPPPWRYDAPSRTRGYFGSEFMGRTWEISRDSRHPDFYKQPESLQPNPWNPIIPKSVPGVPVESRQAGIRGLHPLGWFDWMGFAHLVFRCVREVQ